MALTKVDKSVSSTPGIVDNSNATAITIDSSERVGIGLTSPASPLHVRVTSDANFEVENASGVVRLAALNDARSVNINMEFTSTHFGFLTGNLGLGTTTINTGTLGTANKFLEVAAGTANGSGTIVLSRTTNGNNNEIGGLRFVNTDNADDDGLDADGKLVAAISARSVTSDSNASDDSGANLLFYTKPEAGNYAERFRIDSDGRFLFGTTDSSISSGPGFKLYPSATFPQSGMVVNTSNGTSSNFHLYNTNASFSGFRWYINTNGGTINYSANNVNLSDERLKTNIEISGNYLEKICNIPVKLFNYKDEPEDKDRSLGVIAQEVEAVAPELVNNDGFGDTPEDGVPLKTVYTTDMMYALMKAIQEQQAIIEDLQTQINEVKNGN